MSNLVGNPEDRFSRDGAKISPVVEKPVYGVSDLIRYKPAYSATNVIQSIDISDSTASEEEIRCVFDDI